MQKDVRMDAHDLLAGASFSLDTSGLQLESGGLPAGDAFAMHGWASVPAAQFPGEIQITPHIDSRGVLTPGQAVRFDVHLPAGQPLETFLIEQLGEMGVLLLENDLEWSGIRIRGDVDVPLQNTAILIKQPNLEMRPRKADLEAAGLPGLADDIQAIILCARVVKRAVDAGLDLCASPKSWDKEQLIASGKLCEAELELLHRLRVATVTTSSTFLSIFEGRLRANWTQGYGSFWALHRAADGEKNAVPPA